MGAQGGKLSGAARIKKLSPEQRSEIARKAAAASAKVRSAKAKEKRAAQPAKSRARKRNAPK